MDNRKLSIDALQVLREKAVRVVVEQGASRKFVCQLFGFTPGSLCKYLSEHRKYGEASFRYAKSGVKPGTHSKLTRDQLQTLKETLLSSTPDELGMKHTLWNSRVIAKFIEAKWGVVYAARSIRDLMKRLGFSSQKPIKKAYERDPKRIQAWLDIEYPKIKARAMQEGARIYWADEMGVHSTDNRGKMYGLKGKKPVIKKSGSRFKCNVLAAISPQGQMNWTVYTKNFTGQKFIEFLSRVMRQANQKVFMIVDNLRGHHSKRVRNYIEKHKDKIALFYLPPYSPEMNPQELVNQDVKASANNFEALNSVDNLMTNVRYYLTKIQCDPFKVMSYFRKKEVAYAAWCML